MKIENNLAVPEIGDKLMSSWGYDAQIASWYKVLNVTKTQVTLQPVASKTSNVTNGGMDWTSIPVWDCPSGPVIKKKFRLSGNSYNIQIKNSEFAYKTDATSSQCYNHH